MIKKLILFVVKLLFAETANFCNVYNLILLLIIFFLINIFVTWTNKNRAKKNSVRRNIVMFSKIIVGRNNERSLPATEHALVIITINTNVATH